MKMIRCILLLSAAFCADGFQFTGGIAPIASGGRAASADRAATTPGGAAAVPEDDLTRRECILPNGQLQSREE